LYTAQSQDPQSANSGQATLQPARTDGVGNQATLNVNLAPGSNTLVIGVTNTDNSLLGLIFNYLFQSPVNVSITLTVSGPGGTVTQGPVLFNEENGLPLYLNPGQEFTRGASFVGPGTATVGFVNQSPYVLGVELISTPQQCPQTGC
jgi:hypothetical protein